MPDTAREVFIQTEEVVVGREKAGTKREKSTVETEHREKQRDRV